MNITLNNRPEVISGEGLSLQDLIKYKNYTFRMLVTKVNGRLIKKADRETTPIHEGDDIAIIHMISGG